MIPFITSRGPACRSIPKGILCHLDYPKFNPKTTMQFDICYVSLEKMDPYWLQMALLTLYK